MSIDYPEFSLFCPCDVMDDTNEINCTNYEVDRFIFDRKTVWPDHQYTAPELKYIA